MKANQQGLTSRVRQTFRKQLRRKQLERQFAEHRRNWKAEAQRSEKQWFYATYPDICEDNYHQHLPFLLHFANDPNYNFQLLPLAGYAYDSFLNDPTAEQPLLILEALSQYEEIELPQTEEFVEALLASLERRRKATLSLIANLLEHRRYSEVLRDVLLEAGFLSRGQAVVSCLMEEEKESEEAQLELSLFFSCCCEFVKSHPPVVFQLFAEITSTMKYLLAGQEERYMLFETLASIASSFQPQQRIADHLFTLYLEVTLRDYHNHEHEILQFVIYCLRSGIFLPLPLRRLLFGSLDSHSPAVIERALVVFQMQIQRFEEFERGMVYAETKELGLVGRLRGLMAVGREGVQRECLECLQLLSRCIAADEDDPDQASQLVFIIATALDHSPPELLKPALNILLTALQTVHDEQPQHSSLLAFLQREGMAGRLQSLVQPSQEMGEVIELILELMPSH